jgi:LysM repeat protein
MIVPVAVVLLVLGGILVLAMIACAITSQLPANAPAPSATPVSVVVVPQSVVVTSTPGPSMILLTLTAAAPLPTQTPYIVQQTVVVPDTNIITIPVSCAVRGDWVPYTVQAGDTVGGLAIATNTALADIVLGNCLTNPDIIQVGQVLYLPRTPVVSTSPAVTMVAGGTLPSIGFVTVEPAVVQSGAYIITPGDITIRAQAVSNTRRVEFYIAPTGTATAPTLLGVDDNLTDGAALIWRVPAGAMLVNLWATAVSPDNLSVSTNPILVINNG